jgi:hypothetical protein
VEALLLIFAEIIVACLAPLFALIGAIFMAILELLALMLGGVFAAWAETRRAQGRRKSLVSSKALHWIAGAMGAVAVLGVLGATLFFEPLLARVLDKASERAGMELTYDDASGSLLFGRVELTGVHVTRASEAGLALDLSVAELEADVALLSLLSSEPRLELGRVAGVSGWISPPVKVESDSVPKRERRPFRADLVQASDVAVEIRPKGSEAYSVEIGEAEVSPFRSQLAVFDLLFRSNLEARVAGQRLRVSTRPVTEEGRETSWHFDEVEADRLKVILPRAPLTWLDDGTVTARVEDRWSLSDNEIDMNWEILLEGVTLTVPPEAGTAEAVLAGGLKKLVDARGGDADFRYRLSLTPEQVGALRSGDLSQFWDVVLSGIVPGSAASADPDEGEEKLLDRMRGVFKRDEAAE